MNIKVSGITQVKQLQQLDGMNIEFGGLDFDSKSPSYVGKTLHGPELARLDLDLKKVGIFSNADYETIMKAVDSYALDVVQLKGEASADLCDKLSGETEVIKAFELAAMDGDIDDLIAEYDDVCDYYLFDSTPKAGVKASAAKKPDWKKLVKAKIEKPFFLAGPIGVDDGATIKAIKHPDFFGVDINTLFDSGPGVKDMALILQFKLTVRK